jgi:NADPH:quinone reductase-like Zn-dependent oxidoreductase
VSPKSSGPCRRRTRCSSGVHASTVTRGDAIGVRHVEYRFVRLFTGIRRPRRTTCGSEFAGGANAEYVAVHESGRIAQKPTGLTYEEAAAVPDGSLLALTCL